MKPDPSLQSFVTDLVTTWWTPLFVLVFLAIVTYALWPRNRDAFDTAARMPLRED
jgi:cytochrome c oxidase cbb3-type subunit 4